MRERNPQSPFHLGIGYDYGKFISYEIEEKITGRLAGTPHDYGVLAEAVLQSGGGSWADIGVLYGGSALVMAKTLQFFGLEGRVYAIDPLDGYYGQVVDPPVSRDVFGGNIRRMGAGEIISIVQAKSRPWPIQEPLIGAYIDGDHSGTAPLEDFASIRRAGAKWAVFDNYDKTSPDVRRAVMNAASSFDLVHLSSITAVLERKDAN